MNSLRTHLLRPVRRLAWGSDILSAGVFPFDRTKFAGREGVSGAGEGVEDLEGGGAEGTRGKKSQLCNMVSLTRSK